MDWAYWRTTAGFAGPAGDWHTTCLRFARRVAEGVPDKCHLFTAQAIECGRKNRSSAGWISGAQPLHPLVNTCPQSNVFNQVPSGYGIVCLMHSAWIGTLRKSCLIALGLTHISIRSKGAWRVLGRLQGGFGTDVRGVIEVRGNATHHEIMHPVVARCARFFINPGPCVRWSAATRTWPSISRDDRLSRHCALAEDTIAASQPRDNRNRMII